MTRPLRIANCSGFYGDLLDAPRLLLDGPDPIDVLTGDYLAELTMLILWKSRQRDPDAGYATTFLRQMEEVMGTCLERGIQVVVNAGGLNPRGLAAELRAQARALGRTVDVAVVEGDDLITHLPDLMAKGELFTHLDTGRPFASAGRSALTANAYLGGFGIAEALNRGAQFVVTGRVTDAALVIGPAAAHHGWSRTDFGPLAGALVAGHVIECGTQATGGNYCFLDELPDARFPGFPIAEVAADGSSVINKQPGSGGVVSLGTVTAQLLYEVDRRHYANPDVVADFSSISLSAVGPDRVAIGPVVGQAPAQEIKVAINYDGGYRNQMSVILTGADPEGKAARVRAMLFDLLGGEERFSEVAVDLFAADWRDAATNEGAISRLRIVVKGEDPGLVGREFSRAVVSLTLASVPGMFADTPPSAGSAYGVYWPALIDRSHVHERVLLENGMTVILPQPPVTVPLPLDGGEVPVVHPPFSGETAPMLLGELCGARSGDKGGNANVGVWTFDDDRYAFLVDLLTPENVPALLGLPPGVTVRRSLLPNLRAINLVCVGLLGEGVASSTRLDPQAKGLGEYLRSRTVEVPVELHGRGRTAEGVATAQ